MCENGDHAHHHHHQHGQPQQAITDPTTQRVVVTGKGGVGKTSLAATLAQLWAAQGCDVLALDADPQMNLPYALGLPASEARALVPLSEQADYIVEKVGAAPGEGLGGFLRLNPDVRDVVDRFGVTTPDAVRLVVMGTVVRPAGGCLCPESTLLAAVAAAVRLRRNEAVVMDTQAGVEHFGRAMARGFRHAVVVTDPTFNGVQVALQAARLAQEIGIRQVHLAINRVRTPNDIDKVHRLLDAAGGFDFAAQHVLPHDDWLLACEPSVVPLLTPPRSAFADAVDQLRRGLAPVAQELSWVS